MKQYFFIISILLLFTSCQKEFDVTPKYSNFKTDLEAKNIFSNVKKLQQFRANIDTLNTKKTDKPVPVFTETYTINGNVESTEYFDFFGKTQQTVNAVYDSKNNLIKSITKSSVFPEHMVKSIIRDSVTKKEIQTIIINDSIYSKIVSTYNAKNKIIEKLKINKRDSIKTTYSYNTKNQIIKEAILEKKATITNTYSYNNHGNIIESINGSNYFRVKTTYTYNNDRVFKITEHNIAKDDKAYLMREVIYDRYYNPIKEKHYENNILKEELKITYNFDTIGNWIKKTVALKSHTSNSKKFIPIYVETRTLTYWE